MDDDVKKKLHELIRLSIKGDVDAYSKAVVMYCDLCDEKERQDLAATKARAAKDEGLEGDVPDSDRDALTELGAGLLLVAGRPTESFLCLQKIKTQEAAMFRAVALHLMGFGDASVEELPKKYLESSFSKAEWSEIYRELKKLPPHLVEEQRNAERELGAFSRLSPVPPVFSGEPVAVNFVSEFERLLDGD